MERRILLVVDDEAQLGQMLSETFASRYDVLVAESAEQAINKAVLDHPHCILMDVMMPEMGGFLLCELFKSITQTKSIPIILMSAKPRELVSSVAKEMGAFDYIEKPFSMEEIVKVVEAAMEHAA